MIYVKLIQANWEVCFLEADFNEEDAETARRTDEVR